MKMSTACVSVLLLPEPDENSGTPAYALSQVASMRNAGEMDWLMRISIYQEQHLI